MYADKSMFGMGGGEGAWLERPRRKEVERCVLESVAGCSFKQLTTSFKPQDGV